MHGPLIVLPETVRVLEPNSTSNFLTACFHYCRVCCFPFAFVFRGLAYQWIIGFEISYSKGYYLPHQILDRF